MYKVYINETPLIFSSENSLLRYQDRDPGLLVHHYNRGKKGLFNYIDTLEKSHNRNGVILLVENPQEMFDSFRSIYKQIVAAGGLVFNDIGDILAIYRRGHWDLPKGKLEKNESIEEAAMREVREETGIQNIDLGFHVGKTYHTYSTKKHKRVLKVSYWYHMNSKDIELTPQAEEDIEKAEWVNLENFVTDYLPIYKNIKDIAETYLAEQQIVSFAKN